MIRSPFLELSRVLDLRTTLLCQLHQHLDNRRINGHFADNQVDCLQQTLELTGVVQQRSVHLYSVRHQEAVQALVEQLCCLSWDQCKYHPHVARSAA